MQDTLAKINAVIQLFLDDEDTAVIEMRRHKHGSSSRGFKTTKDGRSRLHERLNAEEAEEQLEPIRELLSKVLEEHGTMNGKSLFLFKRGEAPRFVDLDREGIVASIIDQTRETLRTKGADAAEVRCLYSVEPGRDRVQTQAESLFSTGQEHERKKAGPYLGFFQDCESLHHMTTGGLREIRFAVTSESASISSDPPAHGWNAIPEGASETGPQGARQEAIRESRRLREDAYRQMGTLAEAVLAPVLSPIFTGGSSWPAGRPQYRIIKTPVSTVVISDGLSDCFEDEDQGIQRNGYGLECYMEFRGSLTMADFQRHFVHDVLAQVTQTAIRHGGLVGLLEKSGAVSMQISGVDLPSKWLNDGNAGVLLFQGSSAPGEITLNLQKVKLVGCRLLTGDELARCARDDGGTTVRELAAAFRADGSGCLSPFDVRQSPAS